MATNFRNMQDGGFRLVPRSTDPSSPVEGDIQFADGTVRAKGIWEYKNSAWSQVSSSSSGINYIAGGNAESGISSFVTYADAAGALPVDGTGGSANVTFAVSSSSPLRGLNNFLFTKDAANRQGQGVSYDFTLDRADINQVLNVSFDYEIGSGTFASGDLTVYLYDITNAVVIQPSGFSIQSLNAGVTSKHLAQFQTTTSTSYRLIFHVASTSASAYTVKMENIVLGPQAIQYGAPVTDWVTYTPTIANAGTVTGVSFFYARKGDTLLVKGSFTTGTLVAALASLTLPSVTIDTAKTSISNTTGNPGPIVGNYMFNTGTGFGHLITATGTSSSLVYFGANAALSNNLVPQNASGTLGNNAFTTVEFSLPILGWSSSVQMSNDTDTRVVAARYKTAAGQTLTNSAVTLINFGTADNDTHAAVTVGASWKFTAPLPGKYIIKTHIGTQSQTIASNSNMRILLYKNNSYLTAMGYSRAIAETSVREFDGHGEIDLLAGDYIDVRFENNAAANLTMSTDNSFNWVTVHRLSGPSAIAASESVNARYSTAAGQSISDSALTIIDFGTKGHDSHGAVTTGASWKFTAPVSGIYAINSSISFTNNTTGIRDIVLRKNGTIFAENTMQTNQTGSSNVIISSTVRLIAGDYIDFQARQTSGGSVSLNSNADYNFIDIYKVGN